jgi:hypothetical protein
MTANPRLLFSGHQTFTLRAHWLKKAYDLTSRNAHALADAQAIVDFGVGKNMVESIRYWARISGVLQPAADGGWQPTALAHDWLADDGWDPYLVTPASGWLLHWLICRAPTAFSWYATFNLWRTVELEPEELQRFIAEQALLHGGVRPSAATLTRDVNTLLRCYLPATREQIAREGEDLVLSPLQRLQLMQPIPELSTVRCAVDARPDLPDALVYAAALQQLQQSGRSTLAFPDLAYGSGSPGRIFRLDEDALLGRLLRAEAQTDGLLSYSEQAGHRQLMPAPELDVPQLQQRLLQQAFEVVSHG